MVDIDYDHPRVFDFRTARVVGHSKTKREALDQARPWWNHYKLIGCYFTGRLPVQPLLRPSIILDDETRDAIRYGRSGEVAIAAAVALAVTCVPCYS